MGLKILCAILRWSCISITSNLNFMMTKEYKPHHHSVVIVVVVVFCCTREINHFIIMVVHECSTRILLPIKGWIWVCLNWQSDEWTTHWQGVEEMAQLQHCDRISLSSVAVISLILLWRMVRIPPIGHIITWFTEIGVLQLHEIGVLLRFCPYQT